MTVRLRYDRATLTVDGLKDDALVQSVGCAWDDRTKSWRAKAASYRDIVLSLRGAGVEFADEARAYGAVAWTLSQPITPREHQVKGLRAWIDADKRGVVQLPTGAGKTFLAVLALVYVGRDTLVVVPTIDLMQQWLEVLTRFLARPVGALGGGESRFEAVTVATYDSAALRLEQWGNRFGFLIFDECHHLPAPQYRTIALGSLAPFRLGLSATVERADGKEQDLFALVGPLVYEARIDEMVQTVLAPYDVVTIQVALTARERELYDAARQTYVGFVRRCRIDFSQPDGWRQFVMMSARLPGGREAMRAYREQRKLAQAAAGKLVELWRLLREHRDDRTIVFTDDNELAYRIGCEFVLPVITHQTKLAERQRMLDGFRDGTLRVLVTSKVLNEGVDVPDARVGVVISGSGAVREHVQRLGRILRHRPGKRAVLYELVAQDTSELNVNRRRTRHHAYQGTPPVPN